MDLQRELQVAKRAAREAADTIARLYRTDRSHTQKAGGRGPLTEADLAANAILVRELTTAFPDDGLLSEETRDTPARLGHSRCWIIDPVDGTREFTEQIPEFCVSVGLAIDGEAVLGVLLNPATDELITGVRGQGVRYNGQPAGVSAQKELKGARLLVSRSEHKKGWFEGYDPEITLQPMGSVAWKFGLVAAGRADGTFTPKPRNEWDLCAGAACILAAGGRATDGSGTTYTFNRPDPLHSGVCGTNGHLHEAILKLIQGRG